MLAILIYIFLTITSILSLWITCRIFKEPRTFNLGFTYWIFKYINKIFKTSFTPDKNKFSWALIALIIHLPLILINRNALDSLVDYLPLTKGQTIFVVISAIILIASFVLFRFKIEKIFKELDNYVIEGDPTKIINWIKKYRKYPYFLKIAMFEYDKTENIFNEVHQSLVLSEDLEKELQNELPAQNHVVKKKVNKL